MAAARACGGILRKLAPVVPTDSTPARSGEPRAARMAARKSLILLNHIGHFFQSPHGFRWPERLIFAPGLIADPVNAPGMVVGNKQAAIRQLLQVHGPAQALLALQKAPDKGLGSKHLVPLQNHAQDLVAVLFRA